MIDEQQQQQQQKRSRSRSRDTTTLLDLESDSDSDWIPGFSRRSDLAKTSSGATTRSKKAASTKRTNTVPMPVMIKTEPLEHQAEPSN